MKSVSVYLDNGADNYFESSERALYYEKESSNENMLLR
jgi:hypothetical protein